ncbi:hypothetical protein VIGAN_10161900, partial [Vigna angularis var. angularis]
MNLDLEVLAEERADLTRFVDGQPVDLAFLSVLKLGGKKFRTISDYVPTHFTHGFWHWSFQKVSVSQGIKYYFIL